MDWTNTLAPILGQAAYVSLSLAIFWFVFSLIIRRNDVADVAWGIGFIVYAIFFFTLGTSSERAVLLFFLISFWGTRLALHIGLRNRKKSEDSRYQKWRTEWGKWFLVRSFAQVYLLQGFLQLLIAAPIFVVAAFEQSPLGILDYCGILIWGTGFFFEAVGDYQLAQFIQNPKNKGKIMTCGLWSYTRHPNYFGEITQWLGIFVIAISSPFGWLAIISPLTISFLLLFVSGIPMLEKKYEGRSDFAEYKAKTNALIPWFSKKR